MFFVDVNMFNKSMHNFL